jgi:hypothetical protein
MYIVILTKGDKHLFMMLLNQLGEIDLYRRLRYWAAFAALKPPEVHIASSDSIESGFPSAIRFEIKSM